MFQNNCITYKHDEVMRFSDDIVDNRTVVVQPIVYIPILNYM